MWVIDTKRAGLEYSNPALVFVLLALPNTAATYSPTVTQYHRRDWA